jgi:hydroxyethylthiazole kinase
MNRPAIDAADLPRHAANLLEDVRARAPRVHCLMNTVVQKLVADALSATGGIPSMTSSPEEVGAFVTKADALVVNLGTLDAQRREAIGLALQAASETGKDWVLDPAHCDYSPTRAAFAQALLARGATVLRANAAEHELLRIPADVVCVQTGAEDRVSHGNAALAVANGHPLMAKVTGTGCLSGALIAAFVAVGGEPFTAAASAMLAVGVAAEAAARRAEGPGSFEPALLDALAALSSEDIIRHARVRNEQG